MADADDLYAKVAQELKRQLHAKVDQELKSGEVLNAYDLADQALNEYPDSLALQYAAVLALARAGAIEQAARRYSEFKLDRFGADAESPKLGVDIPALGARISKDRALRAQGKSRPRLLLEAAFRYREVFKRTRAYYPSRAYYPAINAATLLFLAGDGERAKAWANEALTACDVAAATAPSDIDLYYIEATRAEAALICADDAAAERAVRAAASALDSAAPGERDYGAVSTTRRQLRLICGQRKVDADILKHLDPPTVIHYTGHGIGERFSTAGADAVRADVDRTLAEWSVGFGYGSLASGSDIVIAEALRARGAELHVVLPFAKEEFVQVSVAPAGADWVRRFEECFEAKKSVTFATDGAYLSDDQLFSIASRVAMGLALLRARFLEAAVQQVAIWDGCEATGPAGTAVDVALWESKELPRTAIRPPAPADPTTPTVAFGAAAASRAASSTPQRRELRAMLFGDIKDFSKLSEGQTLSFVEQVLERFANVLDSYGAAVLHRNTWGDGLYVVLTDVTTAARCALDLQHAMHNFEPARHGLPAELALRLGGHAGPIFEITDPITRVRSFTGTQVSKTARIEPVTPPGGVYVSEAFAAELALAGLPELICEYVGQVQAAKGYGTMRMYGLREDAS